jgi:hypothetical protein
MKLVFSFRFLELDLVKLQLLLIEEARTDLKYLN